jgi:hypothetical protein
MQPEENDPYFDESEVRGMKELKKILRAQIQSGQSSSALPYSKLFSLSNTAIKLDSLRLLISSVENRDAVELAFENEGKFTSEARASFYKKLFNLDNREEFENIIFSKLLRALDNSDTYLVTRILEESKDFALTESQFEQIIEKSCRIKNSDEDAHNWPMVRFALSEAIKKNNYTLSTKEICP